MRRASHLDAWLQDDDDTEAIELETRASSVVGVAISVTTIPASAYLGVAAGIGDASKAGGALVVLGPQHRDAAGRRLPDPALAGGARATPSS